MNINTILGVLILIAFRTYLKNFDAAKAIYWANRNIVFCIALPILMTIHSKTSTTSPIMLLYYSLIALLFIGFVWAFIAFGRALLNIKNDYVGLLNALGTSLIWVVPIALLVMIALSIMNWYKGNLIAQLLLHTVLLVPSLITALIFHRAHVHIQNNKGDL